jgi:hypothetical protein
MDEELARRFECELHHSEVTLLLGLFIRLVLHDYMYLVPRAGTKHLRVRLLVVRPAKSWEGKLKLQLSCSQLHVLCSFRVLYRYHQARTTGQLMFEADRYQTLAALLVDMLIAGTRES